MNINFKTLLRTACLLLLLLGSSFKQAMASHFAAADINVQCLSQDSFQNKYRITLSVYFACRDSLYYFSDPSHPTPSNAQDNATVSWASINAGTAQDGHRDMVASILDTVDQLCPNLHTQNACYTPRSIYPGFARRVFTDTITLPSRQTDWVFNWNGNARNGNILNLFNPAVTLYIEAGLNNTGKYWNNSTPVFNASPLPYFCVNQKNSISTDPIDSNIFFDGANTYDSFWVYSVQPRQAANATIPYNTGYSANNPFGTTPNSFSMNGQSGNATFIGPNTGYYVVTFRAISYDRVTKLPTGYCERDVQTSVLGCAAPPPGIDTIPTNYNGTVLPGNVLSICPNQLTKFDFVAKSQSNTNYIRLAYNPGTVRNGSYSYDTLAGVTTGHFSWTPTTADIGTHFIEFKATDTTCDPSQPILLSQSLKVTLIVRPGLDAGPDQRICPLGDQPVQLNVNGPTDKVYRWYSGNLGTPLYINNRDIQNPLVSPPVDYSYIVKSADPDFVCKSQDTVVVRVDRSNALNVLQDPLVVCRPSYVTIGVDSVGTGPIQNLACGTFNTITCATPDVITVGTTGNPSLYKENTPFYSNKLYHKYQFIVPKSELKNAGLYSGTLKSISFKSNNNLLAAMPLGPLSISLSCTDNTTFTSATNDAFDANTTPVAQEPAFTITPNAWNKISFTTPYNWDTTKNLIVSVCMGPYVTADTNGYDPVDMAFGSTIQRYSNVIDVCNLNAIGTDIRRYSQRPIVRFDYCSAPELPFNYHWTPGTNLADSTTKYTTAYVASSMNYAVYSVGKNGCLLRDSLHIIVPVYTLTVDPKDTAICVNQPAPLHAKGSQYYKWYENGFNTPTTLSCDDCADPIATPTAPGDIVYTVVFINPDNCFDTLEQRIHVYPLPNVAIVNSDTTIKFGHSVMLMVNGANQYTWTPVGSLNDPNTPNPIATPTQSTTYIVYGIDEHQCRNSDSVRVNVDFRDNLLVPSGFTPNADGRNDYFKLVNVTFQKLMEFRVFNRWGQEIFSTNDPMKGWDGKWKGVDQDMGTYKYIIRVAYPDGYSETYKGDVTLIR